MLERLMQSYALMQHAQSLNARYLRRIDCRPADILRRVSVCTALAPASYTLERVTGFAAAFIDVPAFGAGA